MNKLIIVAGFTSIIGAVVFFIYKEGESKGKITEIKKQQEIEIKIQHDIVRENKEIIKRREVNESIATVDNLNWLLKSRCKNCKGR